MDRRTGGLGGEPSPPPPSGTTFYLLTSNRAKDRANERSDRAGLTEIIEEEQGWLAEQISLLESDVREKRGIVMRAERLRALLLDLEAPTGWQSLCEELLHRDFPVVMMADREGRISSRSWPAGPAIPVFRRTS